MGVAAPAPGAPAPCYDPAFMTCRFALLALVIAATSPARPVKLTPGAAAAVTREILAARAESEHALRTSPTSYLATVDRRDFGDKATLTVGRAADNDLRIDDASISGHHLRVTVAGDRFEVRAVDPQASFTVGRESKRDAVVAPGTLGVGRFVLRLSHQRFPALILYDPRSPRLAAYKGLAYFPVDLAYRFELPLTPNPTPETVVIMSTRGNPRRAERAGWFEFYVGDTPCRLEASRLLEPGVGEGGLSVFFRDATSGRESYELGRYVEATRLANGNYLLDFNAAYNPACAFSPHYNCPIPPKGNTLAVAIRAGEKDSHYH